MFLKGYFIKKILYNLYGVGILSWFPVNTKKMAGFLSRERQTASASLKAQYGTETGKTHLSSVLRTLLNPEKRFTKDTKDWCKWVIAGGECPDVFLRKLRDYDSSQTCGLVWSENCVAYTCRDCGTSPCTVLCADCFHDGDHRGHDYNMYRSKAGGVCDCGEEDAMKKEG